ncbi:DUF4297 family anti-phage-associated protein [Dyadobacter sp. CY347]|uniref:DUF4297 family anti-phage-associated protein n=1 Tax=Dyadobacter sp. CY347 TaxID=2909336 RepID=UPI001F2E3068|nr:DUF4297 family anti-phage-associated protein [Dyadobacter sp. CY347]MCF2490758.1 hypothetical protein [Dyadobacter sp. CY347]
MSERAAIDTIRGYFYQFDYSIVQVLNLNAETDKITIEGIEDVDISTATDETAIQCKYYSKTEYNHSAISEPIRLILNHFHETLKGKGKKINYKLRGHYKSGQSKLVLPLTVESLKSNFLIYKRADLKYEHHKDLSLSDRDLQEFIDRLEIDINAEDFDVQFSNVRTKLKGIFNCSDFSSEFFFYNNALRVIKDLATKQQLSERTISKRDFLRQIDTSEILFNEWFLKTKGEKQHYLFLRKEYFTTLNVSPFERLFAIEIDPNTYVRSEIKSILFAISKKWSKLSRREPSPFCPYIYIHKIDPKELIELKKELISEGFHINDGYDFSGADFNVQSIIKKPDYNNQIKLKIINSLEFVEPTLSTISKTKEIYQFFISNNFISVLNPAIKHIQIQVNNHNDIKQII